MGAGTAGTGRGMGCVVAALPVVGLLPAAVRQLVPSEWVLPDLEAIEVPSVVQLPLLPGPIMLTLVEM